MQTRRLAHVELRCPELEASRDFFVDVLGLLESRREPDTSYLRCFGERTHHSVVLRRDERPGLGLLGWRLPAGNRGAVVTSPDEHAVEAFSEVEAAPLPAVLPRMLNQPAPLRGWGVEPRRLSHAALMVESPDDTAGWWQDQLGLTERERISDEDGDLVISLAASAQPADLMLIRGRPSRPGALHHVAFTVDHRDELVRAADILAEHGIRVESGIGQHGIGQLAYLYLFEPSGNRLALVSTPLLILDDDWEPVRWGADDTQRALHWWGAPIPDTYFNVHT